MSAGLSMMQHVGNRTTGVMKVQLQLTSRFNAKFRISASVMLDDACLTWRALAAGATSSSATAANA